MRKLYVPLDEREIALLKTLAAHERRRPQDQAAVLLGRALARPGDEPFAPADRAVQDGTKASDGGASGEPGR